MHGWQANLKRTCASPVVIRAMPENEIPPVYGGIFIVKMQSIVCIICCCDDFFIDLLLIVMEWFAHFLCFELDIQGDLFVLLL